VAAARAVAATARAVAARAAAARAVVAKARAAVVTVAAKSHVLSLQTSAKTCRHQIIASLG
jgi:hypothetical protein